MLEFEKVLKQYEPMISSSIRRLNIYRDYEEFRQAGRVALWRAWTRFDKDKGDFTPFAYRSIRGAMLDELKRESQIEAEVIPVKSDALLEILNGELKVERFDFLYEAIEQLGKTDRTIIQMIFIEQYSLAECAERFGISVAAVKKRRERMLKKLKMLLEVNKN